MTILENGFTAIDKLFETGHKKIWCE